MNEFALDFMPMQLAQAKASLARYNQMTAAYQLTLSEVQLEHLVTCRFETLKTTGRVEFGEGILGELIYAFCDSPYINQTDYEETLVGLQERFYYFKGECCELLSDDELIDAMRLIFNEIARGSLDYLDRMDRQTLYRIAKTGGAENDKQ